MSGSTTVNVAGVPISTAHFIDGKRVASARAFEDRSPIDRTHLADVSAGSPEDIDAAVVADIAHEAGVPPGVMNVVQGIGEEAGAALVSHEGIDRIRFTGSTDTARLIGQAAAKILTPVSFELGGKSPFIVFADADLDAAARTIAAQYNNAGQVCLAGTRILVESAIAEDLLKRVRAVVAASPVGDPRDPATKIGPVLTWQTFTGEDEVVQLANGTKYGLAAMVLTRNESRALRVSKQLTAASLWVNCFFVRDLAAPFGGARNSGIGREGGTWSMDFYCDVKNVSMLKGSFTLANA